MGQIKNIKLHIVTDIKKTKNKQQFEDERQVEEETHAKVETEEKKDARTIQVNCCCYGDGTTTQNQNKHGGSEVWTKQTWRSKHTEGASGIDFLLLLIDIMYFKGRT